jgi:hypothetical protein
MMAAFGNNHMKNPKTRKIERKENVTLCWVPGNADGITGNIEADEEPKRVLEESIPMAGSRQRR